MRRVELLTVAVAALLVGAAAGAAIGPVAPPSGDPGGSGGDAAPTDSDPSDDSTSRAGVEQFSNAAEFRSYLARGARSGPTYHDVTFQARGGDGDAVATPAEVQRTVTPQMTVNADESAQGGEDGGQPRHSSTNVQERGVDEPDLLKTDGERVYYSPVASPRAVVFDDAVRGDLVVEGNPKRTESRTMVFDASDPSAPRVVENVSVSGRMLLAGDRLVVLQPDRLLGYDVSDPDSPERVWTRQVNGSVVTARLQHGQVYLVTRTTVDPADPCPIRPLGPDVTVACTDVYHPRDPVSTDATYSTFVLDPDSGAVGDSVTFVGAREDTVVYASSNAVYVTYTERADVAAMRLEYLLTEQRDRLPADVVDRLQSLRSYNLSAEATRAETRHTLHSWYATLPADRREQTREAVREGFAEYLADRQRDLVRTGIVRVTVDGADLSVGSVGEVPGTVNDQFSLDEHEGRLRITTTVPGRGTAESANDLYVLDSEDLSRVGATKGMGLTERVYSVRYVEDTAYVVTFRRVDPFHVVDLSDPTAPTVEGKLKLPGFSSYLHPVDENHVLGIGREDGEVKAVLFDVSNPSDPTVADDYHFEAGWSAIAESHHAFLQDPRHGVAVVPTGEGATVLNYTGGELRREHRVETAGPARRTMYLGDFLYVFGHESLTVVDERTWNVTTTRTFDAVRERTPDDGDEPTVTPAPVTTAA